MWSILKLKRQQECHSASAGAVELVSEMAAHSHTRLEPAAAALAAVLLRSSRC